jgi:hypothetical protein
MENWTVEAFLFTWLFLSFIWAAIIGGIRDGKQGTRSIPKMIIIFGVGLPIYLLIGMLMGVCAFISWLVLEKEVEYDEEID